MNSTDLLFFQQHGDHNKPPLVLLHSGGMTSAEWAPQFDQLAPHFHIIAPDAPGHGQSPGVAGQPSIGGNGRAVLELMDALNIEKTHIVGSSMGGATALWLTINHPDRIATLVLFRTSYRKTADSYEGTQSMADPEYWRSLGMERHMREQHLPQGGPDAWQRVIQLVAQVHSPQTTDHNHTLETLRTVQQPVLIVAGDRDPLVPLDQVLDMHATLPNSGLCILPYSTHVAATNTWRSSGFSVELQRFLQNRGIVKV